MKKHFQDCVHWDDLLDCESKWFLSSVGEEEIMQCDLSNFGKCDTY